jgi:hypothetical protein
MERKTWLEAFENREQKEIDLARLYAAQYDHGSPGHLHLKIIAKLAALLDEHEGIETEYTIERTLVEVSKP